MLLAFYHDFGSSFFILDDVPKWKNLRDSETSTNTTDNNEVNTNITVQTRCMHKTRETIKTKQTPTPQVIKTR